MAEPGRSRDGDARKFAPDKIAANGRVRDDGDGRDDDSRPCSKARLSTEQVEEYKRLGREGKDPELARAVVRDEELDTG